MKPPTSDTILKPGTVVEDRFRLKRLLGAGGTGAVWLATDDEAHGAEVVLKILHPHFDRYSVAIKQLEREAELLAQLDHPNIARPFVFSSRGPHTFLAMELIDGRSLDQEIGLHTRSSAYFPDAELLRVFGEICAAVTHAHSRTIIHRDLKPQNVMISRRGGAISVKVLDFGIAKLTEGNLFDATTFGRRIGSMFYMAPEQCKGESADQRSDIFALGVILFELLTLRRAWAWDTGGRPLRAFDAPMPADGANALSAVIIRVATAPRPRPSAVRPDVPVALDEVLARAMAIEPDDRQQTVGALLDEFKAAIASRAQELVTEIVTVASTWLHARAPAPDETETRLERVVVSHVEAGERGKGRGRNPGKGAPRVVDITSPFPEVDARPMAPRSGQGRSGVIPPLGAGGQGAPGTGAGSTEPPGPGTRAGSREALLGAEEDGERPSLDLLEQVALEANSPWSEERFDPGWPPGSGGTPDLRDIRVPPDVPDLMAGDSDTGIERTVLRARVDLELENTRIRARGGSRLEGADGAAAWETWDDAPGSQGAGPSGREDLQGGRERDARPTDIQPSASEPEISATAASPLAGLAIRPREGEPAPTQVTFPAVRGARELDASWRGGFEDTPLGLDDSRLDSAINSAAGVSSAVREPMDEATAILATNADTSRSDEVVADDEPPARSRGQATQASASVAVARAFGRYRLVAVGLVGMVVAFLVGVQVAQWAALHFRSEAAPLETTGGGGRALSPPEDRAAALRLVSGPDTEALLATLRSNPQDQESIDLLRDRLSAAADKLEGEALRVRIKREAYATASRGDTDGLVACLKRLRQALEEH